jgi:hypothetical protein
MCGKLHCPHQPVQNLSPFESNQLTIIGLVSPSLACRSVNRPLARALPGEGIVSFASRVRQDQNSVQPSPTGTSSLQRFPSLLSISQPAQQDLVSQSIIQQRPPFTLAQPPCCSAHNHSVLVFGSARASDPSPCFRPSQILHKSLLAHFLSVTARTNIAEPNSIDQS